MIFLRIIKSFGYAGRGLKQAWKDELNFRIEVITAVLILFLGWWLKLETIQMAVIVLACGLVLTLELVNTMIEHISDMLKPRLDHYVRQIKDLSSAAVLVAALTAVIIAIYIIFPPLWKLLSWQP
ncbi:MAG TPA: diacylglycerol kinase [bacterium]|jgi:diacylglycerol kinase|nr:diacylglycerol kinase [bacterium]